MKILVTGGRTYNDREWLYLTLDTVSTAADITHVIHGAARGADTLAGEWARDRKIQEVACAANWSAHGSRAGYLRNEAMAALMDCDSGDAVVAFPGGRGTQMMIDIAIFRCIRVIHAPPL